MAQKKRIHKKLPKRKKKQKKSSLEQYLYFAVAISLAFVVGIGVGAYLYLDSDKLAIDTKKEQVQKKQPQSTKSTYQEKLKALKIEYAKSNIPLKNPLQHKKNNNKPTFHYEEPHLEKVDETLEQINQQNPQNPQNQQPHKDETSIKTVIKKELVPTQTIIPTKQPKLVIIIDDVTTKKQVQDIFDIGFPVNISFIPPAGNHPNSAKIAKYAPQYMVHLPLQASSSKYEEGDTLHIDDPIEKIEKKIKRIQKLYPKAKFINNHTGSKFTANFPAMDRLLKILKKYNYYFVDSKTTAHSVARKAALKYHVKFYSRDIFLDNKKDQTYIQNQLKKAIKKAKRNGKAIAIGHPYHITFKTLKDSKELLKGIKVIYIEQL